MPSFLTAFLSQSENAIETDEATDEALGTRGKHQMNEISNFHSQGYYNNLRLDRAVKHYYINIVVGKYTRFIWTELFGCEFSFLPFNIVIFRGNNSIKDEYEKRSTRES